MNHLPGGLPGVRQDGTPSQSSDRAIQVRSAYTYQDFCVFIQVCKAIKDGSYVEFWVELHEDFLGLTPQGDYDAFQVKTRFNEGEKWQITDEEIVGAIKRFRLLSERMEIRGFHIYSNIGLYVPAETAVVSARMARSVPVFKEHLSRYPDDEQLPDETMKVFSDLMQRTGCDSGQLRSILQKLAFIKGPTLSRPAQGSTEYLHQADAALAKMKNGSIVAMEAEFLQRISRSSAVLPPALDSHSSPIQANGNTLAELSSRKLVVDDFRRIVSRAKRRSWARRTVGLVAVLGVVVILAKLLAPEVGRSQLERAQDIVMSARNSALPVGFAEAIAVIRAGNQSMAGISLDGATLACQDLSDLDLARIDAAFLRGSGAVFDESNLGMAQLPRAELNMAKFRHAKLLHSDFSEANMLAANFSRADARFARFDASTMQGANLSHADFSGADFKRAKLQYADIRYSILVDADFDGADLANVDISGSDFRGGQEPVAGHDRCHVRTEGCRAEVGRHAARTLQTVPCQ